MKTVISIEKQLFCRLRKDPIVIVHKYEIHKADIRDWCATYDGEKFHAALMDPPYEINFMGKSWDGGGVAFQPETWAGIMEHLHPGAFLFAFGGSRTYHRMACAIEDAGFVLHPAMVWIFGSGFPKSTRIDNQVDAAAGMEPIDTGQTKYAGFGRHGRTDLEVFTGNAGQENKFIPITAPATPLAATWQGHRYGRQALKPAAEFICVAQKPYEGRPVDCITRTGAGALWIDGGRVGMDGDNLARKNRAGDNGWKNSSGGPNGAALREAAGLPPQGRWPANLILSEDAADRLDAQSGERDSGGPSRNPDKYSRASVRAKGWGNIGTNGAIQGYTDQGGASRYFHVVGDQIDAADPLYYCAKASTWERNAGLAGMPERDASVGDRRPSGSMSQRVHRDEGRPDTVAKNHHPTLKPLELNRHLATLLLPPKEYAPRRILCPFAGVASEMIGALLAGWDYAVGVERDDDGSYIDIAQARLRYWVAERRTLSGQPDDYASMPLFQEVQP